MPLPIVPVIFGTGSVCSAQGFCVSVFLCGTSHRGADHLSLTWQTRFWCFGFLQLYWGNFADDVARFRRKKPGRSRCGAGTPELSNFAPGGTNFAAHHKVMQSCHDGSEKAEDTTPNPLLLHALLFGTNTSCNSHDDDGATIATTCWLRIRFDHHNFQHARIRP